MKFISFLSIIVLCSMIGGCASVQPPKTQQLRLVVDPELLQPLPPLKTLEHKITHQ